LGADIKCIMLKHAFKANQLDNTSAQIIKAFHQFLLRILRIKGKTRQATNRILKIATILISLYMYHHREPLKLELKASIIELK